MLFLFVLFPYVFKSLLLFLEQLAGVLGHPLPNVHEAEDVLSPERKGGKKQIEVLCGKNVVETSIQ